MSKKKGNRFIIQSVEQQHAMAACLRNNIKIYFKHIDYGTYNIIIDNKGEEFRMLNKYNGTHIFSVRPVSNKEDNMYQVAHRLYVKIYNKHLKDK